METTDLFEKCTYSGLPGTFPDWGGLLCYEAKTSRFDISVYVVPEAEGNYGYSIFWNPPGPPQQSNPCFHTPLEAMEAALEEVQKTLGWPEAEVRQFIMDEKVLRALSKG